VTGEKRVSPQEEHGITEGIISIGFQDTQGDFISEPEHLRPFMTTIDTSDAIIRTPQLSPKLPPKVPLPETPSSATESLYVDMDSYEHGFGVDEIRVIIEEEEGDFDEDFDQAEDALSTKEICSPVSSVDDNYDDNITPLDELNDKDFLDVLISAFPTEFGGNGGIVIEDEDSVSMADYDPELRQRRSGEEKVLSAAAEDRKSQSRARARAKSLSSLSSTRMQSWTARDLREPLPQIPVVRVSQHS